MHYILLLFIYSHYSIYFQGLKEDHAA